MGTLGLCHYCSNIAGTTCSTCGLPICRDHAAAGSPGMCVRCARGQAIV